SFRREAARAGLDLLASNTDRSDANTAAMIAALQTTMADDVGPFRSEAGLKRALITIEDMLRALGERPIGDGGTFDLRRLEWFDLRNMLMVAGNVAMASL